MKMRAQTILPDVAANTFGASGVVIWYLVRPYLELKPIPEIVEQVNLR